MTEHRKKIALVFLFSLAVHIYGISNPIYDFQGWAQTVRSDIARNYYENGMRFFHPHVSNFQADLTVGPRQFPLYPYLMAVLYKIFGPSDFWGRFISVFFAGLCAVFIYLFVLSNLDGSTAFLSGILISLVPVNLYFTRTVTPEAMVLFFFIAGSYLLQLWLKENNIFTLKGLSACLFLTLAPLIKLPFLPFLLFPMFLFVQSGKRLGVAQNKFVFFLSFFLVSYFSWYGYELFVRPLEVNPQGHLLGFMSLAKMWSSWFFWKRQFFSRFPELLTTYPGIPFFLFGFWCLWNEKHAIFMTLLGVSILYLMLDGYYGFVHVYSLTGLAPITSIMIAAGIVRFRKKVLAAGVPKIASVFFYIFCFSIPLHAALRIHNWYKLHELWVERANEVVSKVSSPNDHFYVNGFDETFYLYHIHRQGYCDVLRGVQLQSFLSSHSDVKFVLSPAGKEGDGICGDLSKDFHLIYKDPEFNLYGVRA